MRFTKYHLELAISFKVKDFSFINLRGADLRGADLRGANLRGADLYSANLRGADLRGADLRDANLRGADLYSADLYSANLRDADIRGSIGDMSKVKSIQIDTYLISYTSTHLSIGCQLHKIEEWVNFDDGRIIEMNGKSALKFWRKFKSFIFTAIELSPAE